MDNKIREEYLFYKRECQRVASNLIKSKGITIEFFDKCILFVFVLLCIGLCIGLSFIPWQISGIIGIGFGYFFKWLFSSGYK